VRLLTWVASPARSSSNPTRASSFGEGLVASPPTQNDVADSAPRVIDAVGNRDHAVRGRLWSIEEYTQWSPSVLWGTTAAITLFPG